MQQEALEQFSARWLPPLEQEMRSVLSSEEPALFTHYGMIQYHMGWRDEHLAAQMLPAGKRLRPLLCLMACAEVGGEPIRAIPAAAAIEILHNFSLVHDDVEDGDETRRHRPTVWKVWGVPQAVNVGDAMFALAFAAMQRLSTYGVADATTLAALGIFTETCQVLTEGQHLDMCFETRDNVTVDEYLRMIQGKTAALIGASAAIGARIGGASPETEAALRHFGQSLGVTFQIQDDILGIWGDPRKTGKAAGNDLLRKKKSLPILHALNDPVVGDEFAALLAREMTPNDLPRALALLDAAGTRAFAAQQVASWHGRGEDALEQALGPQAKSGALYALTGTLLDRQT